MFDRQTPGPDEHSVTVSRDTINTHGRPSTRNTIKPDALPPKGDRWDEEERVESEDEGSEDLVDGDQNE